MNAQNDQELWKPIPGFDGYEASTHGRIRSWIRPGGRRRVEPLVLKHKVSNGYHLVGLCRNSRVHSMTVHQLVLMTHVGPRPPGLQCRHFPDPTRSNNRVDNLSWGTAKENADDRAVHGTVLRGAESVPAKRPELFRGRQNGRAKLNESSVAEIRRAYSTGLFTPIMVADLYSVSLTVACSVVCGKSWKHVGGFVAKLGNGAGRNPQSKLTIELVDAIRSATGKQRDIARRFGISQSRVSAIKLGQSWRKA